MPSFYLLLLAAVVSVSGHPQYSRTVRYDDEVLVKCPTDAPGVMNFIHRDDVDLWTVRADGTADVRIKEALFASADVRSVCRIVDNVEHLVQLAENATFPTRPRQAGWFEEYHRYEDIVNWYKDLAAANPDIVKFVDSIGKSYEGRDQPAVHIGEDTSSKNMFFQCQIHAREWISGAVCMFLARQLVDDYRKGMNDVPQLLKNLKFIFVPFANPDGYEYTFNGDRLWRKNRRDNADPKCKGVDLNRNFPDHWNEGGSSNNPCSETYHGPNAGSEDETKNTMNYFREVIREHPIVGAVDWHSYSQLILRPYGYSRVDCPDEERLRELGVNMEKLIEQVDGKDYDSMKASGLYIASGGAEDWFYSDDANENNNGYRAAAYTFELRDTGQHGFLLPPDQIIPNGEEVYPAVLHFANEVLNNPLVKN